MGYADQCAADERASAALRKVPVLEAEIESLKAKLAAVEPSLRRMAALEEALTASPDTKSAYNGEFSFGITEYDAEGEEHTRNVAVPWTTIKEILVKIKDYAGKV
jgi:hypothetical protein